jgi:hypothetical protein
VVDTRLLEALKYRAGLRHDASVGGQVRCRYLTARYSTSAALWICAYVDRYVDTIENPHKHAWSLRFGSWKPCRFHRNDGDIDSNSPHVDELESALLLLPARLRRHGHLLVCMMKSGSGVITLLEP